MNHYILTARLGNWLEDSKVIIIASSNDPNRLNKIKDEYENAIENGYDAVMKFFNRFEPKTSYGRGVEFLKEEFIEFFHGRYTSSSIVCVKNVI